MNTQPRHRSALADHPDIKEVLPRFVARLPGHVQRLRELLSAEDDAALLRLAHQLRGTGKSYGFSAMSELAGGIEDRLLAGARAGEVAPQVEALVDYLLQVEGYPSTSS